jgi:hypothetical protein
MRKLFILTNLFWIGIITFYSCDQIRRVTDKTLPARATLVCPGCPDYEPITKPGENGNTTAYGNTAGLTVATAKNMADNYKSKCQPLLSAANMPPGKSDARSVWFSIGTLKEFIFNIEKSACTNNCNELALGVRIYFGEYTDFAAPSFTSPTNANDRLIRNDLLSVATSFPEYSNMHTLFMVPTYTKTLSGGITEHIDFDPWHIGSDCANPLPIDTLPVTTRILTLSPDQPQYGKQSTLKNIIKSKSLTNNYSESILLQNHGNLYPPGNPKGMSF